MKFQVIAIVTYTYPEKKLRESKDPEKLKKEVFEKTFKELSELPFLKLKSKGELGAIFKSEKDFGTVTLKWDPFSSTINYIPSHDTANSDEQTAIWKILIANGYDL